MLRGGFRQRIIFNLRSQNGYRIPFISAGTARKFRR